MKLMEFVGTGGLGVVESALFGGSHRRIEWVVHHWCFNWCCWRCFWNSIKVFITEVRVLLFCCFWSVWSFRFFDFKREKCGIFRFKLKDKIRIMSIACSFWY
ncbi:unnamed protein product [Blepharisma stoltei]|uniref:Transmembrane protein n=1 Tax=Blepharisma stoltei TaxID=1481888 RepID=A0AAU9ILD9_9CILI|nr:unnamed protein product [Blepharisma stoltei]